MISVKTQNKATYLMLLDFSKAFNTLNPHALPNNKIAAQKNISLDLQKIKTFSTLFFVALDQFQTARTSI